MQPHLQTVYQLVIRNAVAFRWKAAARADALRKRSQPSLANQLGVPLLAKVKSGMILAPLGSPPHIPVPADL